MTGTRHFLAQGPGQTDGRIPVSLLTGFLGAGKTTLLNALVARPEMANAAVFINELGDVGIDHHLVERIDDALVILDSGCLCCTVQGDLMRALARLHDRVARREIPPVARVLIETTGLADPAPVARALIEDRFVGARFRLDGILTVVDAQRARAQLARHREALVQVTMADRLLLSKCDLASRAERAALERDLDRLNPAAPRIDLVHGAVEPGAIFAASPEAAGTPPDLSAWLGTPQEADGPQHHARHDGRVRSFVVALDGPLGWRGFALAMGGVLSAWEGRLLRAKGLIGVAGLDGPVAVQCVEATAYPPVRLADWPGTGKLADRRGRLVFIGTDLGQEDEAEIRARLAALPGDRDALRRAAASPGLPTRGWLAERMPLAPRPGLQSEAFVIQPRFLGNAQVRA